jgi:UDP-2-acetamido-3-amino-2,3-dideoxy-glucuronate N-acetyltransferase
MSVFVHPTAEVPDGAQVGDGSMVWHQAQLMPGAVVGAGCTVGKGAFLSAGARLGSRVKVGNYANIMGATVEDEAFIGPQAYLMEDPRPRATNVDGSLRRAGDWQSLPVMVRRGATVGGGSLVLPGLRLGEWSMVAAGSVVHRDVPAFALVAGNPARQVGWVCRCGQRLDEDLRCACGLGYLEVGGAMSPAATT